MSNKDVMLMEKNTIIIEENDENYDEEFEVEEKDIPSRDLLIVKRMLGSQIKKEDTSQRKNLFHTVFIVQGKICSIVIDGESLLMLLQQV